MTQITSLTELLEQTGARIRVFDMGRRVCKISLSDLKRFELNQIAYPYPYRQKAWFAILIWNEKAEQQHVIWFLQLPLDERGLLIPAARDDFLRALIARIGENMEASQGGKPLEHALKDSPYTFKPAEQRMAVFHAKACKALKQPPSSYYQHARDYFSGQLGFDQWSFVGLQGIADMAARLDEDDHTALLIDAVPKLPEQPLAALCQCLENERPGTKLSEALVRTGQDLLNDENESGALVDAIIRALSNSQASGLRNNFYREVLNSPHGQRPETLAAISARGWESLQEIELCRLFLDRLAENSHGQDFFNEIIADLVYLPGMRQPLFDAFRDPKRSPALARAVGAMFQGFID